MLDLIKFDILGRNRSQSAFGSVKTDLRQVKGAVAGLEEQARRAGRAMRGIGAGLSVGITAPLSLLAKQSVTLFDTQIQAQNAVAQAITSTGGAAGRSLGQLKSFASELQGLTTFGDEDILRNVTAPLLTFTKVQDETFDRAQSNILDMATLLKMDLKSASLLVGKALNDPIKGLSALSRSGITFSESQKAVIKSLVETGDVASAQALILNELETQFQGQAAAAAASPLGKWRQLKNAIGDVKEELGREIAPFLTPLTRSVQTAVNWFSALPRPIKQTIVVVGGLAAGVGPLVGLVGLMTIGITAAAGAFKALTLAMLTNPIGLIITGVALLATGIVVVVQKFGGFGKVLRLIKDLALEVVDRIRQGFGVLGEAIGLVALSIKHKFLKTFSAIIGAFADMSSKIATGMNSVFGTQIKGFSSQLSKDLRDQVAYLDEALPVLQQSLSVNAKAVTAPLQAFKTFNETVEDTSKTVTALDTSLIETLSTSDALADSLGGPLAAAAKSAAGELDGAKDSAEALKDRATQINQSFGSAFSSITRGAEKFRDVASRALDRVADKLLTSAFSNFAGSLGLGSLFAGLGFANGAAFSGGQVVPFASGGVVSSPTFFPMRDGTGLMGEAGPEAIMPLARIGGKLGVRAQRAGNGAVHYHNTFAPQIDARGADQAAVDRIEMALHRFDAEFDSRAAAVLNAEQTNGAWD